MRPALQLGLKAIALTPLFQYVKRDRFDIVDESSRPYSEALSRHFDWVT